MHQCRAQFVLQARAGGFACGQGRRTAMNMRAGGFDQRQLGAHRALGHHHVRGDAAIARGPGQRGAVVAGRVRQHAARGGGGVQRPDRIAGAAELEGAAALQMFGLEVQLRAGLRIEGFVVQDGRQPRVCRDARGGFEDGVEIGQIHDTAPAQTRSVPRRRRPRGDRTRSRRTVQRIGIENEAITLRPLVM